MLNLKCKLPSYKIRYIIVDEELAVKYIVNIIMCFVFIAAIGAIAS